MSMLLDRFAEAQVDGLLLPPISLIEAKARQRTTLHALTSLSVVIVLVIGLVIGLASVGMASETNERLTGLTAASSGVR
jgi:hypothetical protein